MRLYKDFGPVVPYVQKKDANRKHFSDRKDEGTFNQKKDYVRKFLDFFDPLFKVKSAPGKIIVNLLS